MKIETNNHVSFEVTFNQFDREEGYDDDIRFALTETSKNKSFLKADQISFLLTPDQADKLAKALTTAAEESRNTE